MARGFCLARGTLVDYSGAMTSAAYTVVLSSPDDEDLGYWDVESLDAAYRLQADMTEDLLMTSNTFTVYDANGQEVDL